MQLTPSAKGHVARTCLALAATAAITLTGTIAAQAREHIVTSGIAPQPMGHARFCRQLPQECGRTRRSAAPKLTRERWDEMVRINDRVNTLVQPVTDYEYYATEEFWTYPGQYGDCEDYVLMKRHLLMKAGWPASSLLITVVRQSNGEGHAVLTVRTAQGDYILDNLRNDVSHWAETPYRYIRLQNPRHAGRWLRVNDRRTF